MKKTDSYKCTSQRNPITKNPKCKNNIPVTNHAFDTTFKFLQPPKSFLLKGGEKPLNPNSNPKFNLYIREGLVSAERQSLSFSDSDWKFIIL